MHHVGAVPSEVPGEQKQQLFQVRVQGAVHSLLNTQFGTHHHRLGGLHIVGGPLDLFARYAADLNPGVDRDMLQCRQYVARTMGMSSKERIIERATLAEDRQ